MKRQISKKKSIRMRDAAVVVLPSIGKPDPHRAAEGFLRLFHKQLSDLVAKRKGHR